MIGVGRPLLRKNLANTDPPPCTTPIFNLFSLVAPQPYSKKVQLTLIGSPLYALSNEPKTIVYVEPMPYKGL